MSNINLSQKITEITKVHYRRIDDDKYSIISNIYETKKVARND